ncbi:MAG: DNA polymerase ligase N-terminal domain-containing protein [bacterium]
MTKIDFEGEIPEGYGAGTVKIWDKGEYELLNRDDKKIEICLKGNKLKGYYTLIKFKDNWLLFKYNTPS